MPLRHNRGVALVMGTGAALRLTMTTTTIPLADLVLVERMPLHLRASHDAARNRGVHPHNGSERVLMHRADADALVADDGEWTRVLRPARRGDRTEYEIVTLG